MDNTFDYKFDRASDLDRRITKLSKYSKNATAWAFLDTGSVDWKILNDDVSYFKAPDSIGLVEEYQTEASMFYRLAAKGDLIYRISKDNTYLYGISESLPNLKEVFSNTE